MFNYQELQTPPPGTRIARRSYNAHTAHSNGVDGALQDHTALTNSSYCCLSTALFKEGNPSKWLDTDLSC